MRTAARTRLGQFAAGCEHLAAGSKYGRLTVISFAGKDKHGFPKHKCVCECGREKVTRTAHLKNGQTKGCGFGKCRGNWRGGSSNPGSDAWCVLRLVVCKKNSRRCGYAVPFENESRVKQLWDECEGRCVCCKKKSDKTLHLDHCHKTGRLRGFVCHKCNHVLGKVGDSPSVLSAIARYSVKHCQQQRLKIG